MMILTSRYTDILNNYQHLNGRYQVLQNFPYAVNCSISLPRATMPQAPRQRLKQCHDHNLSQYVPANQTTDIIQKGNNNAMTRIYTMQQATTQRMQQCRYHNLPQYVPANQTTGITQKGNNNVMTRIYTMQLALHQRVRQCQDQNLSKYVPENQTKSTTSTDTTMSQP